MSLAVCPDRSDEGTSKLRTDGAFYHTGNPNAPVPDDGKPHIEDQIVVVEFKRGDTSVDAFSDYGELCPEANDHLGAEMWEWARATLEKNKEIALAIRTSGPCQDSGLATLRPSSPRPKSRRKQKLKPKLPPLPGLDEIAVCPMRLH